MWSSCAFLFDAAGEWRCAAAGVFLPPLPPHLLISKRRPANKRDSPELGCLLCGEALLLFGGASFNFSTGCGCASAVCWFTNMKSYTSPLSCSGILYFLHLAIPCLTYSTACSRKYDAGRKRCWVVS